MVWERKMVQAENSMCKGPVAGVCEEQEHPCNWRERGCEKGLTEAGQVMLAWQTHR